MHTVFTESGLVVHPNFPAPNHLELNKILNKPEIELATHFDIKNRGLKVKYIE